MNERTVGIISIFAGALPAIAGVIVFNKAGFKHRLLVFFLIYGFLSDFFKWQLYDHGQIPTARSLFYTYHLIESVFFSWFIYKSCDYQPVRDAALLLLFVFPVFWAICYFDLTWLTWKKNTSEALFNTVYSMTVTVLASYSILRLTHLNEPLVSLPDFWFLMAIFFYCICTFFVDAFLQTPQMEEYWFIHDLFNIMTMFIYAYGFFRIETQKKS